MIFNIFKSFCLYQRVLEAAKNILLWGCTPDAVLRLNKTEQEIFAKQYMQVYFKDQCHESLCDFLQFRNIHDRFGGNFIQVHVFFKPAMFTQEFQWLNNVFNMASETCIQVKYV